MKILVTGGAGFIGTNLIKRLLLDKHTVFSIDDYSTGSVKNHQDGCTYIRCDILDINKYENNIIKNIDIIFHMAANARIQPSFSNPEKYIKTNFNGNWKYFFESIPNDFDYIATHIHTYHDDPKWWWFKDFVDKDGNDLLGKMICIRSFGPLFRMSYKAMNFLDNIYLDGISGHSELTMSTFLYNCGYKIGDIGGEGRFILPNFKNKYYRIFDDKTNININKNTFRHRPEFENTDEFIFKNMLYHPYKKR